MPTNYIKKLHEEGKGSIKSLEEKWDKAKKIAEDAGRKEDYAYTTGIFENMIGAVAIEAKSRLLATEDTVNNS